MQTEIKVKRFDSDFIPRFLEMATGVFLELLRDPDGEEKYKNFLTGLRNKFEAVKSSLKEAGERHLIDESDFASYYADAEKSLRLIEAGGWRCFCSSNPSFFAAAVNTELVLRAMEHSLGSLMQRPAYP
ncbi:MAG TPA: hypothetical protein VJI33_01110 [Candidatus Paceibacterota bacterium]